MIVVPNRSLASIQTCPTGKDSQRLYKSRPFRVLLQCSRVSNIKAWEATLITCGQKRRCDCYDMHNVRVPYSEAWSWQKSIVKERKALVELNQDLSDSLSVLQQHPVYTLGTGSSEDYLNFDLKDAPYDVYRTECGGEVTYHGSDQAPRIEGMTGVRVGDQKLAAIGIRVSQWIAYHGLALNVNIDLAPFQRIVPCGIRDSCVGSIKGLLREHLLSKQSGMHRNDDSKLLDRSLTNPWSRSFLKF